MIGKKTVFLCIIPLGLALAIAFFIERGWVANSVWVAQVSVDSIGIVTRLGLLITILLLIIIKVVQWYQQQIQTVLQNATQESVRDHKLFVQRLDHEIKNPLTILGLGIVNLLNNDVLDDADHKSLERMQNQVGRLSQLVVDLRALTELEDRVLERSTVDLQSVLQLAIETVTISHKSRADIHLTIQEIPWSVGYIIGDPDLLSIAFTNLLNNALKFTPITGNIEVKLTDSGQFAIVEIADNGIGIPSTDAPYVFEELYRASNAGRMQGSGMGLSIVHRIIKLHQGDIQLHSREGHGTLITMRFPLANRV